MTRRRNRPKSQSGTDYSLSSESSSPSKALRYTQAHIRPRLERGPMELSLTSRGGRIPGSRSVPSLLCPFRGGPTEEVHTTLHMYSRTSRSLLSQTRTASVNVERTGYSVESSSYRYSIIDICLSPAAEASFVVFERVLCLS